MRVSFLLLHFYYSLTIPCVGFDQVLHRDLGDSKYRLGLKEQYFFDGKMLVPAKRPHSTKVQLHSW